MNTLFWDKEKKIYITAGTAYAKKLQGIERHHMLTVDDLVENGGLPNPAVVDEASVFYLPIKNTWYRVISPRNEKPNKYTLEPWAGKVVVVENNYSKGLLDIENNSLIIPYSNDNTAIYPINTNYFVVVSKKQKGMKIIDRYCQVIDEISGTYEKDNKDNKLYRKEMTTDGLVYNGDWSIDSLNKYKKMCGLSDKLRLIVKDYQKMGYGFPLIYEKLKEFFYINERKNEDNNETFNLTDNQIKTIESELTNYTLEDWKDKVTVVDIGGAKGVINNDKNTFVIQPDERNLQIFPISSEFFVVVRKSTKSILNEFSREIDRINGDYIPSEREDGRKELLRQVNCQDGKKRIERRWTIKALQRESGASELNLNFQNIIQELKDNGISFSVIYDKIKNAYHNEKDISTM